MRKVAKLFKKINLTKDEWIWVKGYKGTNKDMKCLNYQYELGTQFDHPDGNNVRECERGFHLCPKLNRVFAYYPVGEGNRYFEVSALVRKRDYDVYLEEQSLDVLPRSELFIHNPYCNKLVAKSIIFERECSVEEIFEAICESSPELESVATWPLELKQEAIKTSLLNARNHIWSDTLVENGYSAPIAHVIVDKGLYNVAMAASSQEDLSMDMRIAFILSGNNF